MKKNWFFLLLLVLALSSCLQKDIELELPPFESELVVECYIMPNQPVRMSVTQTQDYFSETGVSLDSLYVNDVVATLSYEGQTDTFRFNPVPSFLELKYFNFILPDSIPVKEGVTYRLEVRDTKRNRMVVGETQWQKAVPLNEVQVNWRDKDTAAYLLVSWIDPPGDNFYRYQVVKITDDSLETTVDFALEDGEFDDGLLQLGTSFDFEPGDTAQVTLFSISEAYSDYLASSSAAQSANGNPFGQPSRIHSNVTDGIGIFTTLPYARKTIPIVR